MALLTRISALKSKPRGILCPAHSAIRVRWQRWLQCRLTRGSTCWTLDLSLSGLHHGEYISVICGCHSLCYFLWAFYKSRNNFNMWKWRHIAWSNDIWKNKQNNSMVRMISLCIHYFITNILIRLYVKWKWYLSYFLNRFVLRQDLAQTDFELLGSSDPSVG